MFIIEQSPNESMSKCVSLARLKFLTLATAVVNTHMVFEKEMFISSGPIIYIVDFIDEGQLFVTAYRKNGDVKGQRLELTNPRLYANRQFWGEVVYEKEKDRVKFIRKKKAVDEGVVYTGNLLFSFPIKLSLARMPNGRQLKQMFESFDKHKL